MVLSKWILTPIIIGRLFIVPLMSVASTNFRFVDRCFPSLPAIDTLRSSSGWSIKTAPHKLGSKSNLSGGAFVFGAQ